MATWQQFSRTVPDLAAEVERRFTTTKHLVMATLRADGSPRLCGTEVRFLGGELLIAGMTRARRFDDLRRDPRLAVHGAPADADVWDGDARVSGTARALLDPADHARFRGDAGDVPPGEFELFAIDLTEAMAVGLDDERSALVIRSWTPTGGLKEARR